MTEVPEQFPLENLLGTFAEHLRVQPAFLWNRDCYPDALAAGRHPVYSDLLDQSTTLLACRPGTGERRGRINAFCGQVREMESDHGSRAAFSLHVVRCEIPRGEHTANLG